MWCLNVLSNGEVRAAAVDFVYADLEHRPCASAEVLIDTHVKQEPMASNLVSHHDNLSVPNVLCELPQEVRV